MNKKFLRLAIALLFFAQTATAQIVDREVSFNYVDGADYSTNYVKNPSAKKNTLNTTVSSATVVRDTTNKFENVASFSVDTASQNGYVEFTLNTIYSPATSGNCEFKGMFKGDGSLYKAQILDGSSVVLNQTPVLGNSSIWTTFSVTYPCGASGARKVRVTQTEAGTSPAINLAKLYYGVATNVSAAIPNSLYQIGQVFPHAGSTCPLGSLPADNTGRATADYPELFAVIGYTHGGSGATFNVPNLAGVFVRGTGSQTIGAETYSGSSLGAKQNDATSKNGLYDQGHAHTFSTTQGSSNDFSTPRGGLNVYAGTATTSTNSANLTSTDAETRPANISLLYCIQAKNPAPQAAVQPSQSADLLGTVFYAGSSTCPTGSIAANGAAVSRTTYGPLFGKIGTTHGSGDGSTTFNVPNLDGVFVRGTGSQSISAITYSGSSLGAKQGDQFQGHYHQIQDEYLGGNVQVTQVDNAGSNAGKVTRGSGAASQTNMNAKTIFTDGSNGTPRTGTQTHPANISMKACIWTVSQNAPVLVNSVISRDYSGVTTVNTIVSTSENYTATDAVETIFVDATSGDKTVTLPPVANVKGKKYTIAQSDAVNQVIVDGNGAEVICGQPTIRLNGYDSVTIQSTGSMWIGLNDSCQYTGTVKVTNICSSNPCSIAQQKGKWISSIDFGGAGNYTPNFKTGVFSYAPTCNITTNYLASGSYRSAIITTTPTTSSFNFKTFVSNTTANENSGFEIICSGPR